MTQNLYPLRMPANPQHQAGLSAFQEGRFTEALKRFASALQEQESSEIWNDWATTQFRLGNAEEAEEGLRRALELDGRNASAAINFVVLMGQVGRLHEGLPWLERIAPTLSAHDQSIVQKILADHGKEAPSASAPKAVEDYLLSFSPRDGNQASYFQTHLSRYCATLDLLPQAAPGQTLLELGAAFHHLSPALRVMKGYDVRCTDVWDGPTQISRTVASNDGLSQETFVVDNFDVERQAWPYPDHSFDVVLCCEMLEHLISGPMGVITEINRVLKPSGLLLLTTPNMASAKSVEYALRGESPYIYGQYEPGGRPTDHHNREYTANEDERLLEYGGFHIERLFTRESWWPGDRSLLRLWAARGLSLARRGDNTFCLARKKSAVVERYPEEFYLTSGTQAKRRDSQSNRSQAESGDPGRPRRILIVNELLPQTDRNGSDVRLMQIIREMRQQGHHVTYLARNGRFREYYTAALEDLGVKVWAHDAERLGHLGIDAAGEWTLEQVLKEGDFDLAMLLLWFWTGTTVPEHYMGEIRRLSPNTGIAVLTDDHHGLRELRMAELSGKWADYERAEDYSSREFEVYSKADIVLSISEDDRRGLLARNPDLNVGLLPMTAGLGKEGPGFDERSGFLFLGNLSNAANRDAVDWMLGEIWPRVRIALPDAALYLAGSNFPAGFGSGYEGVQSIGHVKDLETLFARHRIFVAPIRFGTGIKTKNLGALGFGLPLITTSIGAEGINLSHGSQALIADTTEEFAASMVRAHTDAILWRQLAVRGKRHVSIQFGQQRLRNAVRALVEQIKPRPDATGYSPSYLEVEERYPAVLRCAPARYRSCLRLVGYGRLAGKFLAQNRPSEAIKQAAHAFGMPWSAGQAHVAFDSALGLLARCHRQLGNADKASYYEQLKLDSEFLRLPEELQPSASGFLQSGSPQISVILPTHNRAAQLELCLAHLAVQSLPAQQWEVIVVDDGSADQTAELCNDFVNIFRLTCVKQQHAGIGAARRAAVSRAQGKYLLLLKDDTIPHCTMLADHLRAQYALGDESAAVLGSCLFSFENTTTALSLFTAQSPLFFSQAILPPVLQAENYCFTASNLSIAKQAVLAAGSFDSELEVAEDIELGFRLRQAGYRLHQHPEIRADHHHLFLSVEEFVTKARRYGAAQAEIFRKHPVLLVDGAEPYGKLDRRTVNKLSQLVERTRQSARESENKLEKINAIDLRQYASGVPDGMAKLNDVVQQAGEGASVVFWYQFLDSFLAAWKGANSKAAGAR